MIETDVPLACPLDGLALSPSGSTWRCADNHCYDIAREGYLNLLPVRFKPSKDPGDTRSMIAARRRVLDAGLFEPLADRLAATLTDTLTARSAEPASAAEDEEPLVLDAGCGEGYYTERLHRHLRALESFGNTRVLGVDISRWAIAAAAKRHRDLPWVVANNRRLPVLQGRCSVIISVFGFETWLPWAAMQRRGQCVLVAHAGPLHLIELRKVIYDTVRVHAPPADDAAHDAGYERIGESILTTTRAVPCAKLWEDILAMTPHGHRASSGAANLLDALDDEHLSLDVQLRCYRRS